MNWYETIIAAREPRQSPQQAPQGPQPVGPPADPFSQIPQPKTLRKDRVWHVGNFDPKYKLRNSLEGHAMSVSEHPSAWESIANLGGNPRNMLVKGNGGVFLDAMKANRDKKFMAAVYQWAVSEGLVVFRDLWRVSTFDDEMDGERYSDYTDFDEALEEAGYGGIEEYRAMKDDPEFDPKIDGYGTLKKIPNQPVLTEKLGKMMLWNRLEPIQTSDAVLLAYADRAGFDGVWWNETLDPSAYSAPPRRHFPYEITGMAEAPAGDRRVHGP
jgi:hypothetical protein